MGLFVHVLALCMRMLKVYDKLGMARTHRCSSAHFSGGVSAAVLTTTVMLLLVVVGVQKSMLSLPRSVVLSFCCYLALSLFRFLALSLARSLARSLSRSSNHYFFGFCGSEQTQATTFFFSSIYVTL